jgi:hypothetical protein
MTDGNTMPEVVGYCFVLQDGDSYIGCVSVQNDEFYGTARGTHLDAMLEARDIAAMLHQERVITESVCACLPRPAPPRSQSAHRR